VLRCGGTSFTFTYSDHVEELTLPSTARDMHLVKCVQRKLDFAFEAAVAPVSDPDKVNPDLFKALHAKKN
jgi:hypothetical protein